MSRCTLCGSYAINQHLHGRVRGKYTDLCDVCYWRADYARLEQECERLRDSLKDADAGMMLFLEQRDAALKQAERLHGLLMEISKSEGRGVDWAQEIDAAMSHKP